MEQQAIGLRAFLDRMLRGWTALHTCRALAASGESQVASKAGMPYYLAVFDWPISLMPKVRVVVREGLTSPNRGQQLGFRKALSHRDIGEDESDAAMLVAVPQLMQDQQIVGNDSSRIPRRERLFIPEPRVQGGVDTNDFRLDASGSPVGERVSDGESHVSPPATPMELSDRDASLPFHGKSPSQMFEGRVEIVDDIPNDSRETRWQLLRDGDYDPRLIPCITVGLGQESVWLRLTEPLEEAAKFAEIPACSVEFLPSTIKWVDHGA
jgi:hypothetical protein